MSDSTVTRRGLLRAGGAAATGVAAVSVTGTASAQSDYDGWLDDVGNYDGTVVDATGQDTVTIEVGVQGNNGTNAYGPPAVEVNPGTTVVWEWVEGGHNVVDESEAFESEYTDETGHTFEYTPEETGPVKYYCGPHRSFGMKGVLDVIEGSGSGGGQAGDAGEGAGGGGGQTGDAEEGAGGGGGQTGGGGEGTSGGEGAGEGGAGGAGGGDAGGDAGGDGTGATGPDASDRMGSTGDGVAGGLVVTALAVAFVSPALFASFLKNRDVGEQSESTRR